MVRLQMVVNGEPSQLARRGRGFQVVQFLRFIGRQEPDFHQVQRADEAVADTEAACAAIDPM
jgi:hypothetical protein